MKVLRKYVTFFLVLPRSDVEFQEPDLDNTDAIHTETSFNLQQNDEIESPNRHELRKRAAESLSIQGEYMKKRARRKDGIAELDIGTIVQVSVKDMTELELTQPMPLSYLPTYLSSIPVQSSHFPCTLAKIPVHPKNCSHSLRSLVNRIINIVCTGKSLYS